MPRHGSAEVSGWVNGAAGLGFTTGLWQVFANPQCSLCCAKPLQILQNQKLRLWRRHGFSKVMRCLISLKTRRDAQLSPAVFCVRGKHCNFCCGVLQTRSGGGEKQSAGGDLLQAGDSPLRCLSCGRWGRRKGESEGEGRSRLDLAGLASPPCYVDPSCRWHKFNVSVLCPL